MATVHFSREISTGTHRRQSLYFRTLLGLLLITLKTAGTTAFSCYQCKGDGSCHVPVEAAKRECSTAVGEGKPGGGPIHSCIKAEVDGKTLRACGLPGVSIDRCRQESGVTVCMCTKELCNTAPDGVSRRNGQLLLSRRILLVFIWPIGAIIYGAIIPV